jgi:hypothetical protein
MGVLEQVSQMKGEGIPEQEIVSRLRQQRVSPKEIDDALNQSRIKEAVYDSQETMPSYEQIPMPEGNVGAPYTPRTQDVNQEGQFPITESYAPQPQAEYAPPQEVYQQETYDYPNAEGYSSDMMIEVSEQVFNEKIKKIEKQIDKMNDSQVLLQTQTEHAMERLKRIELVMDNLQFAILEKIGSYGKNLESIKKEMGMIEDSFTKIIPGIQKPTHNVIHKKEHKINKKKTSKKK